MNTLPARPLRRLAPSPRVKRLALDAAVAAGLLVAAHALYRAAAGTVQLCDSTYSLVVTQKALFERTLDLSDCIPADPAARAALPGRWGGNELPYHFTRRPGPDGAPRVHYAYPLGSSVLSAPLVWYYVRVKGVDLLDADGVPRYAAEGLVQTRIAARVVAATVALFYLLGRFFLRPGAAALVAAGFAAGSPAYSTLSRALWSHTWAVFWLTVALVLLVAARRVTRRTVRADLLFGAGLGTALFWAAFCRQHAVISAAAVGAYLLATNRRLLLATVGVGGLWAAALVACSLAYFGTPQPPSVYAAGMIDGKDVPARLGWLMVSPARGLLVYCPYLAVVAGLLVACRKHLPDAKLLVPAGLAVGGHTLLLGCYNGWHGNWAYGPRYYSDVLPWFVLATALAVAGLAAAPWPRRAKAAWVATLVIGFGWGVFVHHRGANSPPAWEWNYRVAVVGDEPAVKDWRHPQFLCGLTFTVNLDGSIEE
ncbi:MAG: hypothetical protein K2X82_00985 [Gemmataceae bacterium]|nr:hypothetical protein [Gemmataceae bacterium]